MRNLFLMAAGLLTVAAGAARADAVPSAVPSTVIKDAELALCTLLNDCVSPQFRNEIIKTGKKGEPVVCGEFRAFDISGSYGPFERFVVYPKQQPMIKATVPAVFEMVWHSICDVEPPPPGLIR